MCFAHQASGEIHLIKIASITASADAKGPEAVNDDRLTLGVPHLAEKLAGLHIVGVDMTVSEIADQQVAGKFPEFGGRNSHTPGRIELAVLS